MENNTTTFRNGEIPRYAVLNADGSYAGIFCISYEEALDMAANGGQERFIYELVEVK